MVLELALNINQWRCYIKFVLLSKPSDPIFAWFSCFLWNTLKKCLNTSFNKLNFRTGHWYNNNTIWNQMNTKWFENTLTCSDLLFRDLYCSTTCHFLVAKISFWWRTLTTYPQLNEVDLICSFHKNISSSYSNRNEHYITIPDFYCTTILPHTPKTGLLCSIITYDYSREVQISK